MELEPTPEEPDCMELAINALNKIVRHEFSEPNVTEIPLEQQPEYKELW